MMIAFTIVHGGQVDDIQLVALCCRKNPGIVCSYASRAVDTACECGRQCQSLVIAGDKNGDGSR